MQLTSLSLALTRAGFLSFSPASLFAASEQGVWYDPSDIDRYVSQLGTELVTNGDFSSGATGWTFDGGASVSGGSLSFSGVAVTQGATNVGTVSSGKFYQVTFTVVSVSVGGVSISNGTTLGISRTSAGTYTEVFSSGASAAIKVVARGTSTTAVIDNISVRELTALDTATMFQDSVGTTPVTAVEQPVGLILDKSKGLVLGPELVTNGDFSSGTNWTTASGAAGGGTAISGGVLAVTRSGGYIAAGQSIPFVAGKSYRISCLAKRTSGSGAVALVIRTLNDISSTARLTAITASTTDFAVYSAVYVCNTTENAFMQLGVGTSDGVIEFDNISVRELTALDTATMFQDSVGTTPVTAVEQPVGLILDKSKGLVLGPELVTNANTSTTWTTTGTNTVTQDGSAIRVTYVDSNAGALVFLTSGALSSNLTVGKWYKVTFEARVSSGGAVNIALANGATNWSYTLTTTYQTFTGYINYTVGTPYIGRVNDGSFGAGESYWVRNISVRELPGNHATQTTSTSRPVLSARYNLIESTEQFVALRWTRSNTSVSVNATDAPNGNLSAAKLSATATTSTHALAQGLTVQSGVAYRFSCYLKAGEETTAALWQNVSGGTVFDLVAGTVISGLAQATIEPVGNGWFLCSVPYTPSSTSGLVQIYPRTTASYTGDGTSGVYIWGASLTPANQAALPYQRVNTATDYDADPSKFKPYLKFDGVDDWLVTPTITPGTDKAQVFAGVRRLVDTAGVIAELSDNWNNNAGSFLHWGGDNNNGTGNGFNAASRGSVGASAAQFGYTQSVFTPPVTAVTTSTHDIAGDLTVTRGNGVSGTNGTGDKGAGNYLAYPLYIGRRGGTTLPFNGHLYGLIVRFGANLPAGTIASTETWLNQRTGAY